MSNRRMFAGGNTPRGFVSFFDDILPADQAKKRYFLKGSSGSGKSTFIKRVGEVFAGEELDYYHCSNDVNSLDAICIPDRGICIVDGTAPHVCDPEIPLAVDRIWNFADYIDEKKIEPYKEEISSILAEKKKHIHMAYQYLAAAGHFYDMRSDIYRRTQKPGALTELLRMGRQEYKHLPIGGKPGIDRKHFATAVTPDGLKSFVKDILNQTRIVGLISEAGMGAGQFLAELGSQTRARGLSTESFWCPFDPERMEHLVIPELRTAYTTIGCNHPKPKKLSEKLDFSELIENSAIDVEDLHYCSEQADEFTAKAIEKFKASRELHERIEDIYYTGLNIAGLDHFTEEVTAKMKSGEV